MERGLAGKPTGNNRLMELKMSTRHASLTKERLIEAVMRRQTSLGNPGFCRACGEEQDGCEPDAWNYECEFCGEDQVCAPEMLLGII